MRIILLLLITVSLAPPAVAAQARKMERLSRGLAAIYTGSDGVYLSWRLLATDAETIAFDVYRDGKKVNHQPITDSTNYLDTKGSLKFKYMIQPVVGDRQLERSKEIVPQNGQYVHVPLSPPSPFTLPDKQSPTYKPGDASVGDLDGDGEYELVLKWEGIAKDVSRHGYTSPVILEALEMDGTSLWRINLGINVRAGAHYTQVIVYDLNGDGTAEVACRTSDGTVDGKGSILGDGKIDYRDNNGRVLKAPERLTVFHGKTGEAIDSVPYEPSRGKVSSWGDNYGNRCERHLACVAYLDGKRPGIVLGRGYYRANPGRTALAAWELREGKLKKLWKFDTWQKKELSGYIGQGTHSIACGDVDGDGKDEILYGAMAVDHDGKPLYTTNFEHGDAHHFGDLDPSRPGLEFFMPHEKAKPDGIPGMSFRDARTGEILWTVPVKAKADIGRGACADIWADSPGAEAWTSGDERCYAPQYAKKLFSCKGKVIGPAPATPPNFFVWWDGDSTREILNKNWIAKYDPKAEGALLRLLTAEGCTSVNGTKANPVLSCDLHGDWREEVIWATKDGKALRIYTTTIPTKHRHVTLMHDPIYRLSVAWQNVVYNQPPHLGYDLGTKLRQSNKPIQATPEGAPD